jgi:hypothetical protein
VADGGDRRGSRGTGVSCSENDAKPPAFNVNGPIVSREAYVYERDDARNLNEFALSLIRLFIFRL